MSNETDNQGKQEHIDVLVQDYSISIANTIKILQSCNRPLTHWRRVTHITIIGSDNDLSSDRRQAIIWTNAVILLIGPLGTNFSENLIKIITFSFTKMRLKVSSAKWWPFCLGLNVLVSQISDITTAKGLAVPRRGHNISSYDLVYL